MTPLLLAAMLAFAQQPAASDPPESPPPVEEMTPVNPPDTSNLSTRAPAQNESPPPSSLAPTANDQGPLNLGLWLVNLARHQGHLVGRADSRRASLHVIALLEAAREVDPRCAESYQWLSDVYHRMGRSKDARTALGHYIKLAPDDMGARLQRLAQELDHRQTAEKRREFIEAELKTTPLPAVYESQLRTWSGRFAFERNDAATAGKEVERALRLNPMNVQARELAYEMFGETEAALQRVEMALQMIAINPSQVNLVWELGEFLDRLSLHRQAQEWYNRAIDLHRRAEAGPIPADLWQKLAVSYLDSGDFAKAKEAAGEALKVSPDHPSARLLRANAHAKLGEADPSQADEAEVQKLFEGRKDEVIKNNLTGEAAQVAWFFAYHKPDKQKALELAEMAMKAPVPSALAKLAYGYALNANGRTDEAIEVLKPLADTDQLAALELAKALLQRGQKGEAVTLLHKAAALQPSGVAYRLLCDLLTKNNEKVAGPPQHPKIVAVLEKFPRDVFDYYRRTGDFLRFTIRPAGAQPPIAGPIDLVLRLENKAPFTITFGEGMMARPLVAISAKLDGAEKQTFDNYLQVMMSARPALIPGDGFEKTVAVDVGPLRETLIQSATEPMKIEFSAMLDPVYVDGRLSSGLGTVVAAPLTLNRAPLATDETALASLLAVDGRLSAAKKIEQAETIGALLAAAEHDAEWAKNIPADDLRATLAKYIRDADWRVRARAIAAASWSSIDQQILTPAAAAGINDQQAAVRLMAVRLFAMQQGQPFQSALEHLRKADPAASVRTLAASFLPETPGPQAGAFLSPSSEEP